MSDVADYETDILLWSERQAALLRDLRARARNLPNELDLENLAEEIETVGRSEVAAAESYFRLIFIHLIKAVSSPSKTPVGHWLSEVRTFRSNLAKAVTPSMRQRIDLDKIWLRAYRDTAEDLTDLDEQPPGLPDACPFKFDDVASEDFDPRAALNRLTELSIHARPSPGHPRE